MEDHRPFPIDRTGTAIHAEAEQLRARGPVVPIELPGGVVAYSVVEHDAAWQVLSDHRFSKDARRHWTAFRNGEIGDDFPLIGWVLMDNMTTSHGADHTRLRKLTAKAFTPRRVEGMRDGVAKIAATLLDELAGNAPDEVVDLKARYAHPLPAQVICDLFGVPAESRAQLLRGGEVNADTTISPEESAANVAQWEREMHEFVDSKRLHPDDDLTSDLIAAREDGDQLTDSELVGTLHLLLATGTTPVSNLVTNAVVALLTHPDQLALVRAGEVPWRAAIEETLRVDAPVAHLPFRFTVTDVEVGGVTIPEGSPVLVHFAGIGRDPRVHGDRAGVFDVTRADKTNLSFGHGIYRCIGRPLAWLEMELALPALFERFPELELAVPPERLESQGTFIMNGRASLPVRLGNPA